MDKRRIKAVLFIVVFLLVMAVAVNLLVDMMNIRKEVSVSDTVINLPAASADPLINPTTVPVATPVPTMMPIATPMPSEVLTPVITPLPTLTPMPTPTPVPTPTPIPVGESIGGGVFMSQTGVALNVQAVWNAVIEDAEHVKVKVDVYLDSYQINIIPVDNAVHVMVGDVYKSTGAPAIQWDQNVQIQTLLASTEHILYLPQGSSNSFPLAVEYHFGGTYSKTELPVIECGGSISLSR